MTFNLCSAPAPETLKKIIIICPKPFLILSRSQITAPAPLKVRLRNIGFYLVCPAAVKHRFQLGLLEVI